MARTSTQSEAERLAYLQALGVDVWQRRELESPAAEEAQQVATEVPAATSWNELKQQVSSCTLCPLHQSRTQTVFGVGDPAADWMIIGEAPGQEEDRRGEPFVGRAGKLLDQMLLAIGLQRQTVFIANTLKCRPPNNRDPAEDEVRACRPYLEQQIDFVQPKIVLAVGRVAAQKLLGTDEPLGRLRGQEHFLKDGTLPLVVTYHPAYLLRSPSQKRKAWQDLCRARDLVKQQGK